MRCSHLLIVLMVLTGVFAFGQPALAFYHPSLGRFTSRDPIVEPRGSRFLPREPSDGVNLYGYVRNSPMTKTDPAGLAACCCAAEPQKCSISVSLTAGNASVSNLPQMFMQIMVKVELKHSEGKSVEGCHLRQDVHGLTNYSPNVVPTRWIAKYPPYAEWVNEKDYDPSTTGGWPNYKGWWYTDPPGVSAVFDKADGPTDILTYWWQAHVWVIEAPKTQTYWGFQITGFNPNAFPGRPVDEWGGWTYWAGREQAPFSTMPGNTKKFVPGEIGSTLFPLP